jgi:hypothetical protein
MFRRRASWERRLSGPADAATARLGGGELSGCGIPVGRRPPGHTRRSQPLVDCDGRLPVAAAIAAPAQRRRASGGTMASPCWPTRRARYAPMCCDPIYR